MRAYLTFDLGTTALKTALIAADGRALAIHTTEYALLGPRPDWVEMAPQTYWDAVASGTRAVFAESGAAPSSLEGIGFSSQAQTFIPIDRKGRPLRNAIVWVDTRAQEIADEWEATWLPRDEYRRISGYPWLPAALTVFKIAWLARYSLTFTLGYSAGYVISKDFRPLFITHLTATVQPPWSSQGLGSTINNLVLVVGVVGTLTYFLFTQKRKGIIGAGATVGKWIMMLAFGSAFGNTVMARMSLALGRVQFLLGDWLHVIK